jgi:hypothetical protein
LWLVQPDESGLDASPQFDAVWGRRAQGTPGFPALVRSNRRHGFRIRDVRGPLISEVATNVLWGLARMAAGEPSNTQAIVERMWDERRGAFFPLVRGRRGGDQCALTWSALAPLALPDLPEEIGHRLIREQLTDPSRFWTPYAPPSVSISEPSFAARESFFGLRRYWRGPTWVNSAWLVWLGVRRLGYIDVASTLATAICAVVEREGPREFYDPHTGSGMGAHEFAWSTLALEMEQPEPTVDRSYLP